MLKSLSFPITPELYEALETFREGKKNYIQMVSLVEYLQTQC